MERKRKKKKMKEKKEKEEEGADGKAGWLRGGAVLNAPLRWRSLHTAVCGQGKLYTLR